MDFPMQNTGIGGNVENEDDLQVMADKVVEEDSEELVFEETETDLDMKEEDMDKDDIITIMGFTLKKSYLYIMVGIVIFVAFLFRDKLGEYLPLPSFSSSPSPDPTPEPFNKEQ